MSKQIFTTFSPRQRAALIAWGDTQPLGLYVKLTVDAEHVFEAAEVYHRDTRLGLWMIFAMDDGFILLNGVENNEWKLDSVQAVLDRILEQARVMLPHPYEVFARLG